MICYWRCRKIFCKLAHAQCEHSSTEGSLKFVRVWICWEWDIGGIWNWITSNNDLTYLTIKTEMFLNCFCCHIFSSQCSLYNYSTIFVISQSSLQTIFSLIFSRHRHQQTTKQRDARPEKQENIVTKHLIVFFFFFLKICPQRNVAVLACVLSSKFKFKCWWTVALAGLRSCQDELGSGRMEGWPASTGTAENFPIGDAANQV